MLTGRYEGIPHEGENVTPSTWTSMSDSFRSTFETPFLLLPQSGADRRDLLDSIEAMQSGTNSGDQGLQQKSANWLAGFAGGVLSPISLLGGEVAGSLTSKALTGSAGLIGKYLPVEAAVVGTAVSQKRLGNFLGFTSPKLIADTTLGGIAKGGVTGFSSVTGFSLPQAIAETYNPKDNTFNWWGGVKTSFADGGIGVGLMSVPFLAGSLWGKLFRGTGKVAEHAEMPHFGDIKDPNHTIFNQIDEAVQSNKFTLSEGQWFKDYVKGDIKKEELVNRATELLIKDGHPVDAATKRVMLHLLSSEDIDTMQSGLADHLASQVPDGLKPILPKFMGDNAVDNLRAKPNLLDGIQGVVSFLRKRLAEAPEERINLNKILRRLLPENVKEENPFTQSKILKAAKANKSIGITHPAQVEKVVKHEAKINALSQKLKSYERVFNQTGRMKFKSLMEKTQQKINDLQLTKPKLLSHKDEINYLRNRLMKEGQVKSNFKFTKEYDRLLDLTRVRNDARRLMHELHLAYEHQLQDHYATFLDTITKAMRAQVGKLANADQLLNYMKERLVRVIPDIEKIEEKEATDLEKSEHIEVKKSINEGASIATEKPFENEVIAKFDEAMKDAPSEIREEFDKVRNKFKEYISNKKVLDTLIKCQEGALNE